MKSERIKYWAETFAGKAKEYEFDAAGMLKDEDFVKAIGGDVAEGLGEELMRKAARARKTAAKLRSRISTRDISD